MSQQYLFKPGATASVAIIESDLRFPVNRIFCVGRNYLAHAREMGSDVDKSTMEPFYFMKDSGALVESGSAIDYALMTADLHPEMEFVVAIGQAGLAVSQEDASALIYGYACGFDMTRRDLQAIAKKGAKPWDLGKNFDQAAIISPIVPRSALPNASQDPDLTDAKIEFRVNGEIRQSSTLNMMIWNVSEIIAHLSKFYHLQPGDLIYTGTPEGVSAVVSGDRLSGSIEGIGTIELAINE